MREVFLDDVNWETVYVSRSNNEVWWELYTEGNPRPQYVSQDVALKDLGLSNFDSVMWVL